MPNKQQPPLTGTDERTHEILSEIKCLPAKSDCTWHAIKGSRISGKCLRQYEEGEYTSSRMTECRAIELAFREVMFDRKGVPRQKSLVTSCGITTTGPKIARELAELLGRGVTAADMSAAEKTFHDSITSAHKFLSEAIHGYYKWRKNESDDGEISFLQAGRDVWMESKDVPEEFAQLMRDVRGSEEAQKDFVQLVYEHRKTVGASSTASKPSTPVRGASKANQSIEDPCKPDARMEARLRQTPRLTAATAIAKQADLPRSQEEQEVCRKWIADAYKTALEDYNFHAEISAVHEHYGMARELLRTYLQAVAQQPHMTPNIFVGATMYHKEDGSPGIDPSSMQVGIDLDAFQVRNGDYAVCLRDRIERFKTATHDTTIPGTVRPPKRQLTLDGRQQFARRVRLSPFESEASVAKAPQPIDGLTQEQEATTGPSESLLPQTSSTLATGIVLNEQSTAGSSRAFGSTSSHMSLESRSRAGLSKSTKVEKARTPWNSALNALGLSTEIPRGPMKQLAARQRLNSERTEVSSKAKVTSDPAVLSEHYDEAMKLLESAFTVIDENRAMKKTALMQALTQLSKPSIEGCEDAGSSS